MSFSQTLGMRLVSLVTMLVLVAGSPAPALVAYAEEALPAETQAPAPDPAQEPAPQTVSDTPSETQTTTTETLAADGANGAPNEDGGSGESGANGDVPPASDPDGTPSTIDTGDASSDGTVTNDANNTNITTDTASSTDASSTPATEDASTTPATAPSGGGGSGGSTDPVTITLDNGLGATTDASSTATSGDNAINDPDGADIITGRSDAFGYLISLFNIAITNSSGSILFLRNPLGSALDFTQRIMDLFSGLASGASSACTFLGCSLTDAAFNIFTNNEVEISNTLVVSSLTGENRAYSSDGSANVTSGDARAFGGIVNFGNLQIVDSRYLVILMTNAGDLSGDILLPDGAFFKKLSSGASLGKGSSLDASSTADIANYATTTADTGSNTALGDAGASIDTGNAKAKTSVMNFANQIGAPLCFIVNTGGRWNGDVIGLPEGFSREHTDYGDLICGSGGGEDRSVARDNFHASTTNYAKILNQAIVEARTGNNTAAGLDAAVKTGDAQAFLSILNVVNQTIIGQDWIFALFTISGDWNGDLVFGAKPGEPNVLQQITDQMMGAGPVLGQGVQGGYEPDITFTKHASVDTTSVPAKVDYEIVVDNKGGKAHQVIVNDTLKGPDGRTIGTQRWNLGSLEANEKVTISYTVEFTGDLAVGYYTNTAILSGQKNLAIGLSPMMAEDVVEIVPAEEVLGVAAGPQCEPLLTQYLKPGKPNTPAQVQLLQSFLNDSEGENLEVNGTYDAATVAAVHRFQMKYATDILAPWGISKSTGNVYYTTQRKVNDLYCKGKSEFALTTEQILEISKFKAQLSVPKADVDDLIKNHDVGLKRPKPSTKGPLLMPPPAIPVLFTQPVSAGKDSKSTSFLSLPLSLFGNWLLSAVPHVEAKER